MKLKLVVTQAFAEYALGDEITEAAEMRAIRASHPHAVVATAAEAPDAPEDTEKAAERVSAQDATPAKVAEPHAKS